ncbi:hypothetical protein ABD76_09410 [Paenibacillus dendritiformis]|uniref:hypothetical protein n=1 Tax=Paenibacillus dendritiformis TaxID=130049 RepID=UPI0018CE830B|nr:hypothetical protein [Paenibacillus dendritiformis]MBG9792697.1 hypothetical protein [Paenibacillus dendritiformis]
MEDALVVNLRSEAHCNRTVRGIKTKNLIDVHHAIENGCRIQEITYVSRYPEVMLCDLSNPEFPLNLCDANTILDCFELIDKKLDSYLKNTQFKRIYGKELNNEIAICGPIKSELENMKKFILDEVYQKLNIEKKRLNLKISA